MEHEANNSSFPFEFNEKDFYQDKMPSSLHDPGNWDFCGELSTSHSEVPNSYSYSYSSPKHNSEILPLKNSSTLADHDWYHQNTDLKAILSPEYLGTETPLQVLEVEKEVKEEKSIQVLETITSIIPTVVSKKGRKGKNEKNQKTTSELAEKKKDSTLDKKEKNSSKAEKKEEQDKKKKNVAKVNEKVNTPLPSSKRKYEQEEFETDNEMEDNLDEEKEFTRDSSGPPLTRKEKNCEAARKYRKRLREEAQAVAKQCEEIARENATFRGQIESIKKQVEEYKALLSKLNVTF